MEYVQTTHNRPVYVTGLKALGLRRLGQSLCSFPRLLRPHLGHRKRKGRVGITFKAFAFAYMVAQTSYTARTLCAIILKKNAPHPCGAKKNKF
jgi:hypothetical protein